MKKSLLIAASLTLMVSLMGCPSETPNQEPTPEPSVEASESPEPTPTEEPSEPSTPATTEPEAPAPSVLPVVDPTENVGFSLTSATAKKNADFSYSFTINGTGFGSAADYDYLQIKNSDGTIDLIVNGSVKEANSELKTPVEITETTMTFTWTPPLGAPVDEDLLQVDYLSTDSSERSSTTVRLNVM